MIHIINGPMQLCTQRCMHTHTDTRMHTQARMHMHTHTHTRAHTQWLHFTKNSNRTNTQGCTIFT